MDSSDPRRLQIAVSIPVGIPSAHHAPPAHASIVAVESFTSCTFPPRVVPSPNFVCLLLFPQLKSGAGGARNNDLASGPDAELLPR